jgi:AcrR family transcriptional regulator
MGVSTLSARWHTSHTKDELGRGCDLGGESNQHLSSERSIDLAATTGLTQTITDLYFVPSRRYSYVMKKRSDGLATKDQILVVAAHLVAALGPSALTIERVAQAAELSKGAVLYHFVSKDALVDAMIKLSLEQFDAAAERYAHRDKQVQGRYTRAYANVLFHPTNSTAEFAAGLLAAITTNLSLLEPAVARHAQVQLRLQDDGIAPALATLIRLAADGLYFTRAFGLAPPSNEQAARVLKLIVDLSASDLAKKND